MTPKTLSKERREKFDEIITNFRVTWADPDPMYLDIAEWKRQLVSALVDASLSRSELRGIEAAMFGDRLVTEEDLDPTGETEALKAFESAMHLPGNWKWYPGKSSDEAAWKELREFVGKVYRSEGVKAFEEYYTWAHQPYSRGAMTALAIKKNPGNFEASWAAFKASAMYAKKTDEVRPEYKPYKPEERNYVPRPATIKPVIRKPAE